MKSTQKIRNIGLILLVAFSLSLYAGKKLEFKRELNLKTDRISAVEFDLGSGSFELVGTTGNEIRVYATIASDEFSDMEDLVEAFEKNKVFSIERDSDYALIQAKDKEGFSWGRSKNIAIHLEVEVPRGLDVVVDDGSGSIYLENLDGEVDIDDGSGSITLKDIGNEVKIDDGSGSIKITDVNGDVTIEDGSGSIDLRNIVGSIDINDGSGGIHAEQVGGDFRVDDGSGTIVVEDLEGEFKLVDDGSGSIHVNGKRWDKR